MTTTPQLTDPADLRTEYQVTADVARDEVLTHSRHGGYGLATAIGLGYLHGTVAAYGATLDRCRATAVGVMQAVHQRSAEAR